MKISYEDSTTRRIASGSIQQLKDSAQAAGPAPRARKLAGLKPENKTGKEVVQTQEADVLVEQ